MKTNSKHSQPSTSSAMNGTRAQRSSWLILAVTAISWGSIFPSHGQGAATPANSKIADTQSIAIETPSRYIAPDQITEYLPLAISRLDISKRAMDPFGQVQDPTAEPPKPKKPTLTNRSGLGSRPTAFGQIVKGIKINTIQPSKKRFFISNRPSPYTVGDKITVDYRGREIEIEVLGVSAQQVDFQKVGSDDVASVKLSLMPAGMSSGADGLTPPGLVNEGDNGTLKIEP